MVAAHLAWHGMGVAGVCENSVDTALRWRRWQCLTPGAAGPGKSILHSQREPCLPSFPPIFAVSDREEPRGEGESRRGKAMPHHQSEP